MFVIFEKYVQLMILVPFSRKRFRESAYLDPPWIEQPNRPEHIRNIVFLCVKWKF